MEVSGDLAWCSFPVTSNSNVSVWYQGADGRQASNSPDDKAYRIQWTQSLSGWVTTAGINTELAFNDRQAITVQKVISFTGYAFFRLYDAGTKTWSFTVDVVLLDGHPLDRQNSTLSVTFNG